jgi:hypothetical protein
MRGSPKVVALGDEKRPKRPAEDAGAACYEDSHGETEEICAR